MVHKSEMYCSANRMSFLATFVSKVSSNLKNPLGSALICYKSSTYNLVINQSLQTVITECFRKVLCNQALKFVFNNYHKRAKQYSV